MKLVHTGKTAKGNPSITWEYTDNSALNERIHTVWEDVLKKYNWWEQFDSLVKQQQQTGEEPEDMHIVFQLESELYHHVKKEFMYNYGGYPRELNQHLDQMIDYNKIMTGNIEDPDDTTMFDARVELYTNIVGLFQEYGGIPKITHN
tara:strand:+ start:655 stop:1095 length:441 start_codon:yes stop_codon:yes gene_type:complete